MATRRRSGLVMPLSRVALWIKLCPSRRLIGLQALGRAKGIAASSEAQLASRAARPSMPSFSLDSELLTEVCSWPTGNWGQEEVAGGAPCLVRHSTPAQRCTTYDDITRDGGRHLQCPGSA